jgi:hypothetical protein
MGYCAIKLLCYLGNRLSSYLDNGLSCYHATLAVITLWLSCYYAILISIYPMAIMLFRDECHSSLTRAHDKRRRRGIKEYNTNRLLGYHDIQLKVA